MITINDYDILDKLVYTFSPSGFEKNIQSYFSEIMSPYITKTTKDKLNNHYFEIKENGDLPKIMISAHCDSIGFIVKHIDEKGFIYTEDIARCETINRRMLPGTQVIILNRKTNKKVSGQFIPIIPLHFETEGDNSTDNIYEIAIDIGSSSSQQTKSYVNIGDYVVLHNKPKITEIGKKYIAQNLDDRLGLYCMYKIAQNLSRSKIKTKSTVVFVSTTAEESFLGAAQVAANNCKPDISLVIDVTIATDQIAGSDSDVYKKYGDIRLNRGVVISRGIGADDDLFLFIEKLCKGRKKLEPKIPYQLQLSDSSAEHVQIQVANLGIKTAPISIPIRNPHTAIETVSLKDIESTIILCTEICKKISRGVFK